MRSQSNHKRRRRSFALRLKPEARAAMPIPVRRRHKLDLLVTRADSDQYRRYLSLFQQVRLEPSKTKGTLRIQL